MHLRRLFAALCLCLLVNHVTFAQDRKKMEDQANALFDAKDYIKAYDLYDQLYTSNKKNLNYKFRLGYCCLFYPEKKARAIEIFEDIKRNDKSPEADYYVGKAYHINYRFDEAVAALNKFVEKETGKEKPDIKELYKDAKLIIANCESGKSLISHKVEANVKNIGAPINTEASEYVPVITADESIMIFTYVGPESMGGKTDDNLKPNMEEGRYREDVYMSKRGTNGKWSDPRGIVSLNSKRDDAPIAISPDGSMMYIYSGGFKDGGDIYSSAAEGDNWAKAVRLNENINTTSWEGSCSVTADGKYLYFASERPGGLGGRDLYVSEKVAGDWGPAKNLGPTINTSEDEDAPFIHPDGITLFFSSKGHNSIGGYDIMYSIKKENNWLEPINMGIPVNTTEDDRYYVINAAGNRGYFSSNRGGAGGKGEQDIYMVEPGIVGDKPVLALLKGTVYADNVPVEARIELIKNATRERIGPYYSNSKTGKYLTALSPDNVYSVLIAVNNNKFDTLREEVNIEQLSNYIEINKDFYMYSKKFKGPRKDNAGTMSSLVDSLMGKKADAITPIAAVDTMSGKPVQPKGVAGVPQNSVPATLPALSPCDPKAFPDLSHLKGKVMSKPEFYKEFLKLCSNTCTPGVVFKIQIGAYKHPENFQISHLKGIGQPEILKYPDDITRFTMFQYTTIAEAEAGRQKMVDMGLKDSWVVVFKDGKRFTLEELIISEFFRKTVE